MEYSNRMGKVLEEIQTSFVKEIYGNIYLPREVMGAGIVWESSDEEIITSKDRGAKYAGVVTRQKEDAGVTLKATISLDGETITREWKVLVKAAPKKIEDEDYAGYLFAHFIGEGKEGQEQIYFALSEDGLHFKDRNNQNPVLVSSIGEKGVRDPYLCRSFEGDRFFLIATDLSIFHRGGWFKNEQGYYDASTTGSPYLVLWESGDLVHWNEPRLLKVAPKNAGMAWAPEMIYHEETGEYIIFFSSSIMDPVTKYKAKPNAIYYVATRDFVHFSETKLFIDNQIDNEENGKQREIIDTTVLKVGDVYYSASKDGDNAEENGGIRLMKTRNLLECQSWEKVLDIDELGLDVTNCRSKVLDNTSLEGPELFRYNKKDWENKEVPEYGMIADQYAIGAGYLPMKTTNLEDRDNSLNSWKLLDPREYSFDQLKKRHGTIMNITKEELDRLCQAF